MMALTYPEQGYRTCLGIMRLQQHYEPEHVEAAQIFRIFKEVKSGASIVCAGFSFD